MVWQLRNFIHLSKFIKLTIRNNKFYCMLMKKGRKIKRNFLEVSLHGLQTSLTVQILKLSHNAVQMCCLLWNIFQPTLAISRHNYLLGLCLSSTSFLSAFTALLSILILSQKNKCELLNRRDYAKNLYLVGMPTSGLEPYQWGTPQYLSKEGVNELLTY